MIRRSQSITSLVLPNYHDYKKDINENENTSNCFPDDLIIQAAFGTCEYRTMNGS